MMAIIQDPFSLAAAFVGVTLVCLPLGKRSAGGMWGRAGLVYACYIAVSCWGVFSAPSLWAYFAISMGYSLLYLVAVSCLVPLVIKVLKAKGPSEGAMVFLIVMYHPMGLLAAMGIRWVYSAIAS